MYVFNKKCLKDKFCNHNQSNTAFGKTLQKKKKMNYHHLKENVSKKYALNNMFKPPTSALGKSNSIAKAVGRQDQWWNSIPVFRTIGGVIDGIAKKESYADIMKLAGANGIRDIGDVGAVASSILLPGSGRVAGGVAHGLNQLANDIEFAE